MRSPLKTILADKGRKIHSVGREASVLQAVQLMNDEHIGAVLVLAGGRPAGIFTERDVLVEIVAKGRNPAETPLAEVMTRELVVVGSETTVEEAMAVCTEKRCRHLPVMEGDELVGLISAGDLTRWVSSKQSAEIQDLIRYIRDGYFS
jgi:CBS domain-containing protein